METGLVEAADQHAPAPAQGRAGKKRKNSKPGEGAQPAGAATLASQLR